MDPLIRDRWCQIGDYAALTKQLHFIVGLRLQSEKKALIIMIVYLRKKLYIVDTTIINELIIQYSLNLQDSCQSRFRVTIGDSMPKLLLVPRDEIWNEFGLPMYLSWQRDYHVLSDV